MVGTETETGHRPTGTSTGFDHHPMGTGMAVDCRPMANRGTYHRDTADHQTETGSHPMDTNQNYRPKRGRLTAETEGDTGACEYDQTVGKLATDL